MILGKSPHPPQLQFLNQLPIRKMVETKWDPGSSLPKLKDTEIGAQGSSGSWNLCPDGEAVFATSPRHSVLLLSP